MPKEMDFQLVLFLLESSRLRSNQRASAFLLIISLKSTFMIY
ncbi:hypothetical protein [Lysinibacillus sp. 54212]